MPEEPRKTAFDSKFPEIGTGKDLLMNRELPDSVIQIRDAIIAPDERLIFFDPG
jgi:hypothetical protein